MRTIGCLMAMVGLVVLHEGRVHGSQPRVLDGPTLHAHNCYPEHGRFGDRLARALGTGLPRVAIEQDLVWVPGPDGGRTVVSHGDRLHGDEPTLEQHFFHTVTPIVERALKEGKRDTWPVLVLHLDFKTNEPAHHQAVWDLLGRYEQWLTTAERVSDPSRPMPLSVGPVLVLTENGDRQHETFHDAVPVGGRLRLFGTVPSGLTSLSALPRDEQAARLAAAPPEELMPGPATNYRRWTNHSWAVVENGGQKDAGAWTAEEEARLRALTARARAMGLWMRFYALNGHDPADDRGWSSGYNFGSLDQVRPRWDAAIAAGVELIATDQYEHLAERLRRIR